MVDGREPVQALGADRLLHDGPDGGGCAKLVVTLWLGVPVGVATGGACWYLFGRLAHRRLAERGPELLARLRSGPRSSFGLSALDPSSRTSAAAELDQPGKPMPVVTAVGVWVCFGVGFVVLVAQVVVAGTLWATGAQVRAWFLVQYLPDSLRIVGLVVLVLVAGLAIVGAWRLSRPYQKAARKRFGLP